MVIKPVEIEEDFFFNENTSFRYVVSNVKKKIVH